MPALAHDQSGRQRALSIASGGLRTFGLACLARGTCISQAGLLHFHAQIIPQTSGNGKRLILQPSVNLRRSDRAPLVFRAKLNEA